MQQGKVTICGHLRAIRRYLGYLEDAELAGLILQHLNDAISDAKKMDGKLLVYKNNVCIECKNKTDKLWSTRNSTDGV